MDLDNRRAFLRAAAAAGVAWAAADLAQVESALAWAAEQTASGAAAVTVLTRAQAAAIDALSSRILPSVDARPGAREAGVLHFIDKALATFNAQQRQLYADGIADLNRRAAKKSGAAADFAALMPAEQDDVLRDIEHTAFFQAVRFDTIVGMFALPAWGGNRDHAGWHLIGLEHQAQFEAPFGYYDAEINRRG